MKKFTMLTAALMLFAFLTLPIGMRGQTRDVETFTFSELGYENGGEVTTVEGDDVTLTFDQGTNANNAPKYYTTGTGVRMYTGNTLEVALNDQTGETRITAIDFTFAGSYTGSLQNWLGSETSVSFTNTASGQARIQEIAVTFSEGGVAPTTYTVTYNANVAGVDPVVDTYIEGADVTLRASNTFTYDGHTFSEWNTQADGDGDPYDAGDVIENIQANVELYAIWIENTPSDEQWVLTNLADLTEDDVFVIVGNNGSNYAMSNNNGTTSAPAAVAVTVVDDAITSEVAATIQWTISGNATDGYIFYPNGTTTSWLYCTNTNNGVRVGTNANKLFVVNSNYLYNTATSRHIGLYNSQDWRCYSPSSTGVHTNIAGQTFSFYKKVSGGVVLPSISANNVEIPYDATSGSFNFSLNNPVEGGALSVSEDVEWIDEAEINTLSQGYSVTFSTTANQNVVAREGVITLTYSYNRSTVTKNVTVTQAGNPNVTMTIAEVRAQGTGNVATSGIVTSCVGTTGYIQDATAAICVYGASLTVGDEISVSGTLSTYNGLLEITNPQVTVISSGNTINPELMTIAQVVASTNQGWYIRIEEATVTAISGQNTTIAQGDNTIVVRGISGVEYGVNDVISLNGNIGAFNGVQIVNPQNVEVQAAPAIPFITITPDNFELDANSHMAEVLTAITYQNIVFESGSGTTSFEVQYYDAEGHEIGQTWCSVGAIANGDTDFNLAIFAGPNEGDEARTVYFKLYGLDEEANLVYSNLVTVTQAAPVIDYAVLPFVWEGGPKADFLALNGVTAQGLGTDYGANNAPYLIKFDNTGDYIQVKTDSQPGTVTIGVKMIGGANTSTITIQGSADGETFTDIEVLEISGAQGDELTLETTNVFDANDRYVRILFTKGSNVGVGPITIASGSASSINVTPATLDLEAAGTMPSGAQTQQLTVAYHNLNITQASDFAVQFYDAEGEEQEQPAWIMPNPTVVSGPTNAGYMVLLIIEENTGVARSAYFKVYAMDDEDNPVYSNLVTINQAAPVVPPTPGEWVMVSLNDLTEDDVFVIVGVYDEDESSFAMPNNGTGAPSATEVTLVGNTLSGDIDDNLKWNLSIGENGYTFYPNGETETWLYCTNSNNGVRVGTNENNVFTMTPEGYLFNNATERYIGIYNSQDWRCYTSINNNIKDQTFAFYKRVDEGSLVTYTLDIEGYGDSDGGYYLIASPVSMIRPTTDNGFLTEAYDLYYFDQAKQGEEWRNYKAKHFNIASGKGYLYASQENTTLTFTGVPYNIDNDGEIALDYVEDAELAGWNLIGNPYNQDASLYIRTGEVYELTDFYVMNAQGTKLELADRQARPMEGVFVEATAAGEFACFNDGSWMPSGSETPELMDLSVSDNNGYSDLVRIRFGEGRSLKKFMLNPNDTKIYFPMEDSDYAVVYANNMGEMPVNFKAAVNGTYTFDVNVGDIEMGYLHLIDNMTGADVDLLVTPSYSFEARTTDYADRFKLVFAHLTSVEENDADPFAFFSNGSFIIVNQGNATLQVLDMNGRILQSETINGSSSVNVNAAAGTYMLRLVNGDNIKVQKVIVK